jgi:hypothetical protein
MPSKTYFFIAALLLLLISCQKENTTTLPENHKLTTAISRWHDSAFYSFFHYDDQNRLTSIVDSENTNHSKRFTSFIYDQDGKWIKSIYTSDNNTIVGEDSFFYQNDRMVLKKYTNSLVSNRNTYTYDSQGRLIGDTTYSYWSNDIAGYVVYTYDNNDDIISWQEYFSENGILKSDGVISATYNSSINPFSNIGLPLYIFTQDNSMISKHQRTAVTYYDGTTVNYTYEYNPDGSVKRIIETDMEYGIPDTSTIEFLYD